MKGDGAYGSLVKNISQTRGLRRLGETAEELRRISRWDKRHLQRRESGEVPYITCQDPRWQRKMNKGEGKKRRRRGDEKSEEELGDEQMQTPHQ